MDIGRQKNKDVADINAGDKSISRSHENDLISRQAAINKILGQPPELHYPSWYAEQIKELPSAEPQIIYCKDCKHRDNYGCCKHWKGLAMGDIPIATDDNNFCSHAKRRNDVSDEK